jgi:hypothetical protein
MLVQQVLVAQPEHALDASCCTASTILSPIPVQRRKIEGAESLSLGGGGGGREAVPLHVGH